MFHNYLHLLLAPFAAHSALIYSFIWRNWNTKIIWDDCLFRIVLLWHGATCDFNFCLLVHSEFWEAAFGQLECVLVMHVIVFVFKLLSAKPLSSLHLICPNSHLRVCWIESNYVSSQFVRFSLPKLLTHDVLVW